jgi:polar amino acid transport system substrate-binding protein
MLFFSLTLLSSVYAVEPRLSYSGHPNYPPYMWIEDGELTGVGVKLLEEVLKELKISATSKAIDSWERVQQMTKRGDIDILVGAYKNEEREKYMSYSVAYLEDPTHIFTRKDATFAFKRISDLVGKRGIAMYGESYGKTLDCVIENKLNVRRVYKASALFFNLKERNVDYILWGYYPWSFNGMKQGALKWCKVSGPPIVTEGMYITISRKSSLLQHLSKINKVIERLKKEGKIKKWLNEYSNKYKKRLNLNKK